VDGARPRGGLKKAWRAVVEKDCQARELNKQNALNHKRWVKQIRCEWVNVSSGTGSPGLSQTVQRAIKWL